MNNRTKNKIAELGRRLSFRVNDIETSFNKSFQLWLYKNSYEKEIFKNDKYGRKRLSFDDEGFITNATFSGKTASGFDLLQEDFIKEELQKINAIDSKCLDLDGQKYIAFLKDYFENKEVKPKEAKAIETIKNNFDDTPIERVCEYFKKNLVDTNHLKEDELNCYLKLAFDQQEKPTERFKLNHKSRKKIKGIFYNYYKEVAGKPHGRLEEYLNLLKDYFIGFETEDYTNFSKIY